jgi:hypothetical protein
MVLETSELLAEIKTYQCSSGAGGGGGAGGGNKREGVGSDKLKLPVKRTTR